MKIYDTVVFLKNTDIKVDGRVYFTVLKGDTGTIIDIRGEEESRFKSIPEYIIDLHSYRAQIGILKEDFFDSCLPI